MKTACAWWRVETSQDAWWAAYRMANLLLRAGVEAHWATEDGPPLVHRGDFVIAAAEGVSRQVVEVCRRLEVRPEPLPHPPAAPLARLARARVAVYGGGGAPYNHARILADLGFDVSFLPAQAVRADALQDYDVFIVPGGGRTANRGQLRLLGEDGARAIARFVERGGLYLGSCAGAHNVSVVPEAAGPKYGQRLMQLINVGMWHGGDVEWHWQEFPGIGVILCRNLRPDHPVMWGMPEVFPITHYNGPFFSLAEGALEGASAAVPLAAVVDYTDNFTPGEYALSLSRYGGRAPGSVIERAIASGGLTAVVGYFGTGRVVVFGSHPEFGYTLEMDAPQAPARMLANAVFWQSTHGARARESRAVPVGAGGTPRCEPIGTGLRLVGARVDSIRESADALRAVSLDPLPKWLDENLAMSTFGLSAVTIWQRSLNGLHMAESCFLASISRLGDLVQRSHGMVQLSDTPPARAVQTIQDELVALEHAVHYDAADAWGQDFGYQGLLRTLDTVNALLRQAAANLHVDLPVDPDPYAHDSVSPYHLVAAAYYSALGVLLSAWYLARTHESRLEQALMCLDLIAGMRGERTTVRSGARPNGE